MGLFDKKYCDVCGDKIGLLGNRKLDDGNLCKNCAAKLSPFFSERRHSTVAQIKEQLAYREENARQLASFHPTVTIGNRMKVWIDPAAGKFIATRANDWHAANPDLLSISQVTDCRLEIKENKDEIYTEDANGNQVSYNPPRYEVEYLFNITILVDSPWFAEIEFELSDGNRPESPYNDSYREYERQANELIAALKPRSYAAPAYGQPQQAAYAQPQQPAYAQPAAPAQPAAMGGTWVCPSCNAENTGKFCEFCGAGKP